LDQYRPSNLARILLLANTTSLA